MKRWRWHILLFIVVYALALGATLPAAVALRWAGPLPAQLPQLQGVEGSLWSGRAVQASYRGMTLGELQWEVSPWHLLIGRFAVKLKLNHPDGYLDGEVSSGLTGKTLRVTEVTGQLPAAMVKSLVPSLPLTPTGSFSFNVNEAVVESSRLSSLDGRIVWNKGGVSTPMALQFGDLVADFSSDKSGIASRIKDSGGPLQLAAELKLASDGSYTLTGKSAARPGADPALGTSLSLLGKPDAQGMVPFTFSGRL